MDGCRGFCGLCCKRVPHGADYGKLALVIVKAHILGNLFQRNPPQSKRLADDLRRFLIVSGFAPDMGRQAAVLVFASCRSCGAIQRPVLAVRWLPLRQQPSGPQFIFHGLITAARMTMNGYAVCAVRD